MDALFLRDLPEPRDPIFVMAFAGWNDAAEAATLAARYLVERLKGERFASIPSEDFYQFSDQRPLVRLDAAGRRQIHWPVNEFFYCRAPSLSRDLVVGIGVEPHLQWRRFSRDVLEIIRRARARLIVTMGALLAGELHTAPIRLVSLATDPALVEPIGVEISSYEGPTGIVGVIHSLMQDEGIPAVSLWANVPHYIAALPNPKASFALLDRFRALGGIPLDLGDMELSAERFERQVEEAISQDPRFARYVSQFQEGGAPAGEEAEDEAPEDDEDELPPGDQVADEVERFLRRRRGRPEE